MFAEDVGVVQIDRALEMKRGRITVEGDRDGDGVLVVFILPAAGKLTHDFEIGATATVTTSA